MLGLRLNFFVPVGPLFQQTPPPSPPPFSTFPVLPLLSPFYLLRVHVSLLFPMFLKVVVLTKERWRISKICVTVTLGIDEWCQLVQPRFLRCSFKVFVHELCFFYVLAVID